MTPAAERLRKIQRFDQLVAYLRDELDWPMVDYPFEDMTFDWDAEELGIDLKTAAKIQEIKQLRPLASDQEWGIFFVKFEPKQLPVVALRRLLSKLVIKKRASAQAPDMASWQMHDLLFVSQYGEGDHRKITFANFTEGIGNTIPTLKVLDWDEDDTGNKLQYVDQQLRSHLRWPEDQQDVDAWRTQWSAAFKLRPRQVIKTAKELATAMAVLCRDICDETNKILEIETENGPIRKLFRAFQKALIHDLEEPDFADMYAQTITYGLFSAAVSGTVEDDSMGSQTYVDTERMVQMVPITNPFLREMLSTFLTVGGRQGELDFDELGVQEVVELLNDERTDLNAVLRDFGNRGQGEDPVIHFYEDFLKQYDKKRKVQRGVFYTPQPVVSFIVRSVDELLRTEFRLEDGLADITTWGEMVDRFDDLKIPEGATPDQAFVQILDPATGTGTFLVEAIDVIYNTLRAKWEKEAGGPLLASVKELWNDYVPKHLLPRLHGYELMMAPYAIAHMKIGLKLDDTGYSFGSDERARIYLTNALEPPSPEDQQLTFADWFPALAHEAQAVNAVKRHQRFTVVIGNPPYANFGQLNRIPFVLDLLDDYKMGLGERKINLDDDFIKFIRFSQHLLDLTGVGAFGMITNNVFIDGITHRRMRESIKASFGKLWILDLHGSSKKLEKSPDGSKDENVFDIQQGVGISLFSKTGSPGEKAIHHAELWGSRESKYNSLCESTVSDSYGMSIACPSPYYFFVPKAFSGIDEYESLPSIVGDVFVERNAGIQTKRDRLVYHFTRTELEKTLADVRTLAPAELTANYCLPDDGRDWRVGWAKDDVQKNDGRIIRVAYHPFDLRWTYFTGRSKGFMAYPRTPLMWSALEPNRLLLAVRNPRRGNIDSFFIGNTAVDKDSVSPFDNVTFFPLYVYADYRPAQTVLHFDGDRCPNFSVSFLQSLCASLNLPTAGSGGLPVGLTPEDIFHYIYAIFNSPSYRGRYAEFLKIDFPRVPLTNSLDLFRAISRLGEGLAALHLMESPKLDQHLTTYVGPPNPEVAKVSYVGETVWLDKIHTRGFRGVPEDVWNFHIGGYQICEKWLKYRQAKGGKKPRPGGRLTEDDINHYQRIVVALSETIRIMAEIDEVIDQHGGWPDAFVTEPIVERGNKGIEAVVPAAEQASKTNATEAELAEYEAYKKLLIQHNMEPQSLEAWLENYRLANQRK